MNQEAAQIVDKIEAPPQAPKEEAKPKEPAQETNAQEKVSSKVELLIRREQQALMRERQAKEREAQLEARLKDIEAKESKFKDLEDAKRSPKRALEILGLSYDEITQAHLNDGELPPQVEIKKLREEIEAYKQAQKQERDTEKERAIAEAKRQAEAQEQKATQEFKEEIGKYLTDNSARYEFIQFEGQEDLVYGVIDEHYNRTYRQAQEKFESGEITEDQVVGKVMSIKEAADKVEAHLEQKYHKARELNKVKSLYGVKEAAKEKKAPEINLPKITQARTLTNQLSASPAQPQKANRILTDQERVQKAIAYARGLRP